MPEAVCRRPLAGRSAGLSALGSEGPVNPCYQVISGMAQLQANCQPQEWDFELTPGTQVINAQASSIQIELPGATEKRHQKR